MSFLHEKVFDPILNSKDVPANIISGGNMNKTINEQIQNIAQKKDTLCRRMYN